MGQRSFKVPQPDFSNWIIHKRQELNLTAACLRERLGSKLSYRTLKYLEDGRKDAFSEYTLNILAQGLEMGYADLLHKIDALQKPTSQNGVSTNTKRMSKLFWLAPAILTAFLLAVFLLNGNKRRLFSDGQQSNNNGVAHNHIEPAAEVLIHPQFPQLIVALDNRGMQVWQKNLRTRVCRVQMADLNNDGRIEIIAGTIKDGSGEKGEFPGLLKVWDTRGKLITKHNVWRPSIYEDKEPQANVSDFAITDLEKDGVPDIVALVRGYEYAPSRVAVFHFEGDSLREVSSFWNPGYLLRLFVEDVNGDGFPEIICTGVNNDFKRVPEFQLDDNVYSIFMLDGRSISGQAPPNLGKGKAGKVLWYGYITPPSSRYKSEIVEVIVAGDDEKEIRVKLRDTCYFYLNYAGEIVGRFEGDDCTGEAELHIMSNEMTWEEKSGE